MYPNYVKYSDCQNLVAINKQYLSNPNILQVLNLIDTKEDSVYFVDLDNNELYSFDSVTSMYDSQGKLIGKISLSENDTLVFKSLDESTKVLDNETYKEVDYIKFEERLVKKLLES